MLYFAASIVTQVEAEKRAADLADLEDKVRGEYERINVDRDEALAALEDRLSRRREYFTKGKERSFDEDDEFWVRGLTAQGGAGLPTVEEARALAGGIFTRSGADRHHRGLEEDPRARPLHRGPRRPPAGPRDVEAVGNAAVQILEAAGPAGQAGRQGDRLQEGAVTKHMNKVRDFLLAGEPLEGEDVQSLRLRRRREEPREGPRARQRAPQERPRPGRAGSDPAAVKELAYDLCLREGAKKEDFDALSQWALKVREMYQDIESRRGDAREAAVDSVARLEQTWQLFSELEPKMIVNDEMLFRELTDRFGSPYGFGVYFKGGMGAEAIRDLPADLDLDGEAKSLREIIRTEGPEAAARDQRLKVVNAFITSENRPEWMILEAIPVIPPELRPMVQPDGGRFATSDLNDLYRRVINRNNRLEAAARPRGAGDHRQQREAHAAGGRRRPLRQRTPRPSSHGPRATAR